MDITTLHVGIIGGTGDEGKGLALRWARAGARVTIGSRSTERAAETANQLNALPGVRTIASGDNKAAAKADFVILAVPFAHAASTLESLIPEFHPGATVIDLVVPVSFEGGRARYVELAEGSASEMLQSRLPATIPLVAAFKTEPAHLLLDPSAMLDCDTFVAGNSADARNRVMEAIRFIEGLRPIDAGPLSSARALERMTVLLIGINRRYKSKTGRFRLLGV